MNKLLKYFVIALFAIPFVGIAQCDLPPAELPVNTGVSMTIMLTPDFVSGLNIQNETAYIVATSVANGLVVGYSDLSGVSQTSIAIWGDDSITPELDGATSGEAISFQLIDGIDLYDISPIFVMGSNSFGANVIAAIGGSSTNLICSSVGDEVLGCIYSGMSNYNPDATVDDGSCIPFVYGCMDSDAFNYNADANTDTDPSSCIAVVNGCIDVTAFNYQMEANTDDGSCYAFIIGCLDTEAFNYNDYDYNGHANDLTGINGIDINTNVDGLCEYLGCTSNWADNYMATATLDDGSCFRVGCTNSVAINYDALATNDDGSCLIEGCMEEQADNYNSQANIPAYCQYLGCTNQIACNYNIQANEDDGSCQLPPQYYDCSGNCIHDTDNDGVCNELEIEGCQNPQAYNFDPAATDPGFCQFLGCTDIIATNYNSIANVDDGSCYIEGCMNETALNYNTEATLNNEDLCIFNLGALPCEVPSEYSGLITGSNMNVLFTSNFSSNLEISSSDAYIVAITASNMIVGSTSIQPSIVTSLTIWGNDSQTQEIDGALSWEHISLYLVDQSNYYLLTPQQEIQYTENQTFVLNSIPETELLCLNGALTQILIYGCTDPTASNYIQPIGNPAVDVNTEDGTCEYSSLNNCLYQQPYTGGITGNNMSILLTHDFISSLPISFENAYVVASNQQGVVFGSVQVGDIEITALTIWGDDTGTSLIDGSTEGEELNLYLVNDKNLYDILNFETISYSNNSMQIFNVSATINSLCTNGLIVFMEGCTDELASNFNEFVTDDNGSCIYEGCTYPQFYEYNDVASIDDQSCDNVIITGCTNPLFVEYNPVVTEDDGSCEYTISRIDSLEMIEMLHAEQTLEVEQLSILTEPIPLDLYEGWNLIGYPLNFEQNCATVFQPIEESVKIVKNNRGLIYWPEIGYNGLGDLKPGLGYQIYMTYTETNFEFVDMGGLRVELSPAVPDWMLELAPIHPNDIRTLAMVLNTLGQQVDIELVPTGTPLLYLYNDGSVEMIIK